MTFVYAFCRATSALTFKCVYRWKIAGRENLIEEGPAIYVANHTSFFDPPIVGSVCRTELHYLARRSLLKTAPMRWLLPRLNVHFIEKEAADSSALRMALGLLKEGHRVVIFPEGTRSSDGELQEPQAGVGWLAVKSQVRVVPVRIFGAFEVFSRHKKVPGLGKLGVHVGESVVYSLDGKDARQRYVEVAKDIMQKLADLPNPR
ncbi:MAG: lysophospholipid acyltransferase family protein [Verrucomicrobiales bacterium]